VKKAIYLNGRSRGKTPVDILKRARRYVERSRGVQPELKLLLRYLR
jgi:hypothetical protein